MRKYNRILFIMIGIGLALLLTVSAKLVFYSTTAESFTSKQAAYSVMDSKAESIIPENKDVNTEAGRSPIVILSVITIILILSGTVYVAQKEQENK